MKVDGRSVLALPENGESKSRAIDPPFPANRKAARLIPPNLGNQKSRAPFSRGTRLCVCYVLVDPNERSESGSEGCSDTTSV